MINKLTFSSNDEQSCFLVGTGDIEYAGSCEKINCYSESLYAFGFARKRPDDLVYSVYRYLFEDKKLIDSNVKFDLTIIYSGSKKKPCYNRTRGHYHLPLNDNKNPYFDIYQIHSSSCVFQLHKKIDDFDCCYVIFANDLDILMLPPTMCHVAYNFTKKPAYFSNWCTRNEHLDYETMKHTNGPALNLVSMNNDKLLVEVNRIFFPTVNPKIKLLKPIRPTHLCSSLKVKSPYILDWKEESHIMRLLNDPTDISNWIDDYYIKNNDINYEIIN